ncbi:hypothetical protein phiLo_124 [Thermus phage phiLo]|nr:hypothetical protein phiLo_124 [Thermus phage phiLo]
MSSIASSITSSGVPSYSFSSPKKYGFWATHFFFIPTPPSLQVSQPLPTRQYPCPVPGGSSPQTPTY